MRHLAVFVGISALLIVTPGPDMALVTKNAALHGRRAALGACAGLAVWTLAAALGIASIVRASAVAFTVRGLAGAAYLAWLGVTAIVSARRHVADGPPRPRPPLDARGGLLTRPRVRAAIDRLTGVVLIAFGLRLATEQR